MPLILEDVQPIFPRALLSERSLKPISCLAQNNEVLEPAGRAQLHTSPMKKLWMIYNCKYTHTHKPTLHSKTWTYAPWRCYGQLHIAMPASRKHCQPVCTVGIDRTISQLWSHHSQSSDSFLAGCTQSSEGCQISFSQ